MWDSKTITTAGLTMLSRYASGATLTISHVAAGTGTVSQAVLPDQTALFDQKQSAAPVDLVREGNRVTVKMEFPAVGDAYTMNQIGVYASVNGEAEQLLAIYQDESGIPIPAASSAQSFLLTFYGGITIENNGAVTITIDSGTYATMGTLVEYLARKQDRITAVGLLKRNQNGEIVSAAADTDYIPGDEKGAANGVATLGNDGKVPSSQLPAMDYIPTTAKGAVNGVATLGSDGKVPSGQLPAMNYIPTSAKGAANGVATLDNSGKVPSSQLPAMDYVPTSRTVNGKVLSKNISLTASDVGARASSWTPSATDVGAVPAIQKGAANGVATLGNDGKVPSSQLPAMDYIPTTAKGAVNGVATLGSDGKVPSGQLPAMNYIPTSAKGAANGVATLGADTKVPVSQMPYQYSTVDLNPGVSPLATGTLYFVYE